MYYFYFSLKEWKIGNSSNCTLQTRVILHLFANCIICRSFFCAWWKMHYWWIWQFFAIVNAIAFIYLFCKTLTLNISNENLKRLVCQRYGSFLWGTPLQPKILNTHRWRKRWFLICLVKYIVHICSLQVVNLFILVGMKGKQFIFFYKRLRIWN